MAVGSPGEPSVPLRGDRTFHDNADHQVWALQAAAPYRGAANGDPEPCREQVLSVADALSIAYEPDRDEFHIIHRTSHDGRRSLIRLATFRSWDEARACLHVLAEARRQAVDEADRA